MLCSVTGTPYHLSSVIPFVSYGQPKLSVTLNDASFGTSPHISDDDMFVHIQVLVVVDRDNIKKIVIGKGGAMLKEIGSRARHDMEEFLGKKVYLETYVKTLKNWRDEERYFLELGLKDEDE